ncbi:hypothetical protein AcV5_010382 [Taiwanofungus camphoratus]|nr:hypothetical protein AcV5_010382 [Antrodia cinnamomea]
MDEVNGSLAVRRDALYLYILIHYAVTRSINIFIWGVALSAHAACKNLLRLFIVRSILGMCEGSITAGFMIVSSMFYTRNEQTLRIGYWCKACFLPVEFSQTVRVFRACSLDERYSTNYIRIHQFRYPSYSNKRF